jgi:GAF domain-containing protein
MILALRRVFTLQFPYDDFVRRQQAQRLLHMVVMALLLATIWTLVFDVRALVDGQLDIEHVVSPMSVVVSVWLYVLVQRGYVMWAGRIFVGLLCAIALVIQTPDPNSARLILFILPVVFGSVVLQTFESFWVTVLVTLWIVQGAFVEVNALSGVNAIGFAITLLISGLVLVAYIKQLEGIITSSGDALFKLRVLGRRQRPSDSNLNSEDIIRRTIQDLRHGLGYSYIRVVLLDDNHVPMQGYYSSIGVEGMTQMTTFDFMDGAVVQQVLHQSSSQVITRADADEQVTHLLTSSQSGVIIPVHNMGRVVALFDIQSEAVNAIQPEIVNLLELFVENAVSEIVYQRTLVSLRDNLKQQQQLIHQQKNKIAMLQNEQAGGIVSDWEQYLAQRGFESIGYDIDDQQQVSDLFVDDMPDVLRAVFETGEVVVSEQDNMQHVGIPISFRDAVVGAMCFSVPIQMPITARKRDFLRSVTERLAMALDNKRLLEETRIRAQREHKANEIGSELLRSSDVKRVLQDAVVRFNEALGAVSTRIYLQPMGLQSIDDTPRQEGDV